MSSSSSPPLWSSAAPDEVPGRSRTRTKGEPGKRCSSRCPATVVGRGMGKGEGEAEAVLPDLLAMQKQQEQQQQHACSPSWRNRRRERDKMITVSLSIPAWLHPLLQCGCVVPAMPDSRLIGRCCSTLDETCRAALASCRAAVSPLSLLCQPAACLVVGVEPEDPKPYSAESSSSAAGREQSPEGRISLSLIKRGGRPRRAV